jgi:hypothetical protein
MIKSGPPIHNMGPCSRPGEDPNSWKQFDPRQTRAIEPRYRPPGQRGILGDGLRGGVRVGRPFSHSQLAPSGDWPGDP